MTIDLEQVRNQIQHCCYHVALSNQYPPFVVNQLHDLDLELKNLWLELAASVIARFDIPDGSIMDMGSVLWCTE